MKKRFFAMFLATAMALSLVSISAANVSVSSTASNPKTDISPKTASEIVALSFMKNSLNSNIEISETTPFYDLDGNITAYCVSFHLSQEPKGYVLISLLTSEDPIVEFSFEGPGLVDTIQRSTQSKLSRTPTINYSLSIISSEIPENAGVFSVFATSELAFSLVFSLMGRNKGKFFYTAPTT